ncbi:MAG TPA: inositol monophosphatase family protein [Streptosporangiaceae bacterium]|jgi:myo-inositol-1(or 4)-monophosphatase|nr:inositol monophosphatase family protein [Streptosporangiaceae bacterium]
MAEPGAAAGEQERAEAVLAEGGPDRLLELACLAAREAGAMLADGSGKAVVVSTKSSPTDVVTEMDQAAERLIRERIGAARPGDAILGEEGGQTGGDTMVRWIVDPLDGTVNYLYDLPDWAVSIAAEVGGEVVAGAVCVPRRNALYYGTLGGGSYRVALRGGEPERLACNADVPLARALIATGFGYDPGRRRVQGQVVACVLPAVRDIRRIGAAAADLCALAAGNVDGYYERGVQYWDIAAGSLIAREAGAIVGGLAGKPAGSSMTVAGGPALFAELHDLLVSLDPERDT